MSISLADIREADEILPPRVCIYGRPKIGKSTWASQSPNPIFIQTEEGLAGIADEKTQRAPARWPLTTKAADVFSLREGAPHGMVDLLIHNDHPYLTLVIDSIDELQRLIFGAVEAEYSVRNIADIEYGKGYRRAVSYFQRLLTLLDQLRHYRRMQIILIGHDKVEEFHDPTTAASYNRFTPNLHDRIQQALLGWVDVLGYATFEVSIAQQKLGFGQVFTRGLGGTSRVMHTQERPAFLAGSRYTLPKTIPLDYSAFERQYIEAVSQIGLVSPQQIERERHDQEQAEFAAAQSAAGAQTVQ